MTITFIGTDYEGVGCVKITKGDLDPATTPDSQVSAFLYNSKWAADVKLEAINLLPWAPQSIYRPPGSGIGTYTWYTYNEFGRWNRNYMRTAYFPDLPYSFPLFDVKSVRLTNNRYVTNIVQPFYTGWQNRGGQWTTQASEHIGWCKDFQPFRTDTGVLDFGTEIFSSFVQTNNAPEEFKCHLVVWRLPGDSVAIKDSTPQPSVPGQDAVEITSTACRAAKPGFDVRTATRTQLAFDSSHSPAKIISAADIALPPGYSEYDTGFDLPPNTVLDVHFYQGDTIYYPANPADLAFGAEHWIAGTRVCFQNPYGACRVRFLVIAFDDTPPTAGDNEVFRQFKAGGQDVVQFLRPGAGNLPSFADIVLDSRWPCLQILAEGYIPVVADGAQTYEVNFNGEGLFPFVKYMTAHGAGQWYGRSFSKRIRMPFVNRVGLAYGSPGWSIWDGGDSTFCKLTASKATFHTFRGAPILANFSNSSSSFPNNPNRTYDSSPIQGIRYYIFGIPQ